MEAHNKGRKKGLSRSAGDVKSKRKDIEKLEERIKDLEDKWKRAVADYRNLERRSSQEAEAVVLFSKSLLLTNFLLLLDNLEIAQKSLKDSGIELIIKQFKELLEKEGVTEISCKGKDFDPEFMEAVGVVEGKEGKVIEVVQKGYKLFDKALRPARVKVGKAK